MTNHKITKKQQDILDFIKDYQEKNKTVPTLVEMASKFGVTIAAIQHRITALTRKRVLLRENIYKISATTVPSAPIAKVEEQMQSGVGMERPLL
jgi:SOS-response transcriptional repressor LexA